VSDTGHPQADLVTYAYRGFLLSCDAARIAPGRFQAHVVIARRDDLHIVVSRFFPVQHAFVNEAEAVEHARAWGTAWIDENDGQAA
jgi:hypothetical protein